MFLSVALVFVARKRLQGYEWNKVAVAANKIELEETSEEAVDTTFAV